MIKPNEIHIRVYDNGPDTLFIETENENGLGIGGFENRTDGEYRIIVIKPEDFAAAVTGKVENSEEFDVTISAKGERYSTSLGAGQDMRLALIRMEANQESEPLMFKRQVTTIIGPWVGVQS